MILGAMIESPFTFNEGSLLTARIEFIQALGVNVFAGTPGVTELGKPSVTISNPRVNTSEETIDNVTAQPGQAILFEVEVTQAKKQKTVLRIDAPTNSPNQIIVQDLSFQTRK